MDPGLNRLLKWGIENTSPAPNSTSTSNAPANAAKLDNDAQHPSRDLDASALQALMGGPSDAELMKESMAAIQSPDISLPNKLVAFDNLEQLIEQIDNANNMHNLGLWTPLLALLASDEPDLRRMAAWCMGTAVQNNVVAQERVGGFVFFHFLFLFLPEHTSEICPCQLMHFICVIKLLIVGAIPSLIQLALEDPFEAVRRKAIYALSSGIRNYQPGLNAAVEALPQDMKPSTRLDAGNMEAVDGIIQRLKIISAEKGA